ncbi:MAG: SCP2 sterol-binding domain-containing protein [Acidimicrobiales bacterium]
MAEFLSDAWFAELEEAAGAARIADDLEVTIQQVITDGDHELAFSIALGDGVAQVRRGRDVGAQVTFTQDRAPAVAISQGTLSAQVAFLDGRLRLGGDITALLDRAGAVGAVDDLFGAVRADTTWA